MSVKTFATTDDIQELNDKIDLTPTDSKYFDIDYDGIISLKPAYRGHPTLTDESKNGSLEDEREKYFYAISDMGEGKDGSLNHELPERIVIPEVIGDTAVTGFQIGMFYYNYRVKGIVLPDSVTDIPKSFCWGAINLEEIKNTEHIQTIDRNGFRRTKIKKALFPNLKELKDAYCFCECAYLHTANIGNHITSIPDGTFGYCASLSRVAGGDSVTTIGGKSFMYTFYLKNLPLLNNGKLTKIGAKAFNYSRIQFDWSTLPTTCNIEKEGDIPTYPTQDEEKDGDKYYWEYFTKFEGTLEEYKALSSADPRYYSYFPCANKLGSTFGQGDPRWKNDQVFDSSYTYGANGCGFISLINVFCAFGDKDGNPIEIESPLVFEEIIRTMYESTGHNDMLTEHPDKHFLEAVDLLYNSKWESYRPEAIKDLPLGCYMGSKNYNSTDSDVSPKERLRFIYRTLASGGYVVLEVNTPNEATGGHAIMLYGVNDIGEVLVVEPSHPTQYFEPACDKLTYSIPIQNFTHPTWSVRYVVPYQS